MLIDDNPDDNFFHRRIINKSKLAENIVVMETAEAAISYLKSKEEHSPDLHPNLIFLDINMPGMNGWEFLDAYEQLGADYQSQAIVVMLTTSDNPDHISHSKKFISLSDFKTKPLTVEMIDTIVQQFF